MKVEMTVLGSTSPKVRMVSVDVKQHFKKFKRSELRSCVKVEVAVLGSPSLIVLTFSVELELWWRLCSVYKRSHAS